MAELSKYLGVILAVTLALPASALAAVRSEQTEDTAQMTSVEKALREIRPSMAFLPRQEDGILKRFDNLDYAGMKAVLKRFKPWSLTYYSHDGATVPTTQATQIGNSFPDSFTAERDRVFLFGERAGEQRYTVLILRNVLIKDFPVSQIPADSVHAMVVAQGILSTVEQNFDGTAQTIRPVLTVESAGTIAADLGRLPDPQIEIHLQAGDRLAIGVRVDSSIELEMGRIFRQPGVALPSIWEPSSKYRLDLPVDLQQAEKMLRATLGQKAGSADVAVVGPAALQEVLKGWDRLFRLYKLPGIYIGPEAQADFEQLTPADTAALLAAVRKVGGLVRIMGIQVRQHPNGERVLFLYVHPASVEFQTALLETF